MQYQLFKLKRGWSVLVTNGFEAVIEKTFDNQDEAVKWRREQVIGRKTADDLRESKAPAKKPKSAK